MKIALVIPWFGQYCVGGAEKEAQNTAINLQKAGFKVEILTTCLKDSHANWNKNFYEPGEYNEDSLLIRRFPVKKGDHSKFNKVLLWIKLGKQLNRREEEIFVQENVRSSELNQFISRQAAEYDFFIFIPYLYGTTIDGAAIVPEKSLLISCLHNENFARLKIFKEIFNKFLFIVFHTEAEKKLAEELYGIRTDRAAVLGEGVNTDLKFSPGVFKKKYRLTDPYLLFVGRKDEGKNLPLLVNYFAAYKRINKTSLKLVLIGRGDLEIPPGLKNEIIDLGYVPEQDKLAAYADALVTVQPSLNESFSLVLMESWLAGVAVLVNGFCAVTRDHCLKSSGGLFFKNFREWAGAVDWFVNNDPRRRQMGANGRQYVLKNFSWEIIMKKYRPLLESLKNEA